VHVAAAGPHAQVEAREPARPDAELELLRPRAVPVEDDAGVGAALVLAEEVDNRVPADLLLAVTRDADVHRQLAPLCEQLRRLQEGVQLPFVVGDPPCVVPAVALRQLEGPRLPQVERRRRLHVEVPVDEYGRRRAVAAARGNLAEDELPLAERRDVGLAPRALHEVGQPSGRAHHVLAMRRIGAHRRDRDELPELVEPSLLHGA
jgi:hypothetical protein